MDTKDSEAIIGQTVEYVKSFLDSDVSGHDWWHVYRVWRIATGLANTENADLLIVQLAALLHDISDYKLNGGDYEKGAEMAREWLNKFPLDESVVGHVCDIISRISFRGALVEPEVMTIEAMVVQDADRLDAIGAIGIARAFAYGGVKGLKIYDPDIQSTLHKSFQEYQNRQGGSINHFYEKLLVLKDLMNTASAKTVAIRRHKILQDFLTDFFIEWEMKDVSLA
jgi:uncharacterized protein